MSNSEISALEKLLTIFFSDLVNSVLVSLFVLLLCTNYKKDIQPKNLEAVSDF